jgi:hypothetical protein
LIFRVAEHDVELAFDSQFVIRVESQKKFSLALIKES